MNELSLVSVMIPSYNYAHYITNAIESVLAQTYSNFELLIVDNRSTDNTEQVIQPYLQDERVSFYKNAKNLGMSRNFNQCVQLAKGKYIKLLMADDLLHPTLLEKFVNILESYPQVTLVTSYSEIFGSLSLIRKQPFSGLQNGEKIIIENLREGTQNWIGEPTTVMFRTEAIKNSGLFNTKFYYLVDLEMWVRILLTGDCFIIPEVLSYFRAHEEQISVKNMSYHASTFEDYLLYKQIQNHHQKLVHLLETPINEHVKRKAIYSGDVMFKVINALHKKKNRAIFIQSLKIALKEKVFVQSVTKVCKAVKQTGSKKSGAAFKNNN